MKLARLKELIDPRLYSVMEGLDFDELRPSQSKAIKAGLLDGTSLLICTPTASGKTLVAELAFMNSILKNKGKAVYIVPLKALANEKHKEFKRKYGSMINIGLSIGDLDSSDTHLHDCELIICTAEKLDSLTRHHVSWLKDISVIVIDEIHLLNDHGRGPTLEILLTIMKQILKDAQFIGLSATIGNEKELAEWLEAKLVHDTWRPVVLHKGIYHDGKIEFQKG